MILAAHVRIRPPGRVRPPWLRRLLTLATLLLATFVVPPFAAGAWAADAPNAITVQGTGLSAPISIKADSQRELFNALLRQVSWMAGLSGDPIRPDPATLGPKYTLTVYAGTAALQVYDLYPQAPGGPRAHRPAAQPQAKVAEAWFYASVAMPDMLAVAGVPVTRPNASGQAGGLTYEDPAGFVPIVDASTPAPVTLSTTLRKSERTLLLWLLTPFAVVLLLILPALHSRRYGRGR